VRWHPLTHRAVLYKLVTFAILMAVAPIGSYFGTLDYMWNGEFYIIQSSAHAEAETVLWCVPLTIGNTTYAAICAVAAANIVLVGYVIVAFREEAAPPPGSEKIRLEQRKDR